MVRMNNSTYLNLRAFSLIEVVLAMGVFLITVLALVGLMGPALKSVSTVETADEVASVVDSVNAFLNSSTLIEITGGASDTTRFDAIYTAIQNNGYATIFVHRWDDSANDVVRQEIGFRNDESGSVGTASLFSVSLFGSTIDPAGPLYRAVLTASSAMLADPDSLISSSRVGDYSYYTLSQDASTYDTSGKSYLAMEVRIFAEESKADSFEANKDLAALADEIPIFVYDTAILRN